MFGFMKKFFPKKGEDLDDLDDMYYEEQPPSADSDMPQLQVTEEPEESKVSGILPDLFRRLMRKREKDDPDAADVLEDEPAFSESTGEENDSNPQGLLSKINNLEGVPKYIFLGVATLVACAVAYSGIKLFKGDSKQPRASRPPVVERQVQAEMQDNPAGGNPMTAAVPVVPGAGIDNPFAEGLPDAQEPGSVPAAAQNPPAIPATSRALPTIPAVPNPTIPEGMAMPSQAPQPAQASVVQGVVTSSDGQGSIAIMGDGTVVSVGETYKDGRIAFIGGDGITFEDGRKIQIQQW